MKKRFKTDARVWVWLAVSILAGAAFSVLALAAAALLHAQSSLLRVSIGAVAVTALVFLAAWLAVWNSPGDHQATAFVLFGMLEGSVHSHVLGRPQVNDQRFKAALVDALLRVSRPDLYRP